MISGSIIHSKSPKEIHFLLAFIVLFFLNSCGSDTVTNSGNDPDSLNSRVGIRFGLGGCRILSGRNTVLVGKIEVEIWVPEGNVRADLLLLPGWGFSRTDWCEKSLLCRKALHDGYRLVMPEMGKSIYASQYFPESRSDWTTFPTSTWLSDTLIPELQKKYCLLQPGSDNYMIGLSTGGRGIAMLALKLPTLFRSGVALSGDYDQTMMQGDNLMRGIYGDYNQFPERWVGEDNPALRAAEIKIPLYLGHGKKDLMVPWIQTQHFYELLRKSHPDINYVLNLSEESGHDYSFWGGEVDKALDFFKLNAHTPAESTQ